MGDELDTMGRRMVEMVNEMAKEKRHHLKLLKLEAFLRIKAPELLDEYNTWWEITKQLEEAVGVKE